MLPKAEERLTESLSVAWRQMAREDIPGSGQSPLGKIMIKGAVKGASKVKLKSFLLFT